MFHQNQNSRGRSPVSTTQLCDWCLSQTLLSPRCDPSTSLCFIYSVRSADPRILAHMLNCFSRVGSYLQVSKRLTSTRYVRSACVLVCFLTEQRLRQTDISAPLGSRSAGLPVAGSADTDPAVRVWHSLRQEGVERAMERFGDGIVSASAR